MVKLFVCFSGGFDTAAGWLGTISVFAQTLLLTLYDVGKVLGEFHVFGEALCFPLKHPAVTPGGVRFQMF